MLHTTTCFSSATSTRARRTVWPHVFWLMTIFSFKFTLHSLNIVRCVTSFVFVLGTCTRAWLAGARTRQRGESRLCAGPGSSAPPARRVTAWWFWAPALWLAYPPICKYTYIYIYIYICIYRCIYINVNCVSSNIYTCVYIHIYMCIYICLHIFIYPYIYIYECIYIYMDRCIYICNHIYIYI